MKYAVKVGQSRIYVKNRQEGISWIKENGARLVAERAFVLPDGSTIYILFAVFPEA